MENLPFHVRMNIQTFQLWSESSSVIFISKISKTINKILHLYEPYFGVNFGNVKKCEKPWENLHKIVQKTSIKYLNFLKNNNKILAHNVDT